MPTIIGVRFRRAGRLYYYDPGGIDFAIDDLALVEAGSRTELANVVLSSTEIDEEELREPLKSVIRRATDEDRHTAEELSDRTTAAMTRFGELIAERDLPIKPIKANWSFDGANLTFNIATSGRVDFSGLASELAEEFQCRIELRQIGARERASLVDGLGRCGLSLCCSSWLVEPGNVTVRMAKNQNLPLNPAKISGVCGRLLCCLRYEHDMYIDGQIQLKPEEPVAEVGDIFTTTPADDDFFSDEAAPQDEGGTDRAERRTTTRRSRPRRSRRQRRRRKR